MNLESFTTIEDSEEEDAARPCRSVQLMSPSEIAEALDVSFPDRSALSPLPPFDPNDFSLSRQITDKENQPIAPVECIVTCFPHPSLFPKCESTYVSERPLLFGWRDSRLLPPTDFQGQISACYKTGYQKMRPQIKLAQRMGPSVDHLDAIFSVRREMPIGRNVFHYIGSGLLSVTGKSIPAYDPRTSEMKEYPVKRLFESFGTPSAFIFDCDNAGAMIKELTNCEQEMLEKLHDRCVRIPGFGVRPRVDDWFSLCLCDEGESLPCVSFLPRDFLTSCLLSPLRISILCHILNYYRNAFPEKEYLRIADVDETVEKLMATILDMIIDAIVSECVSSEESTRVFHDDLVISSLFRRFVLAQYLLKPYNLHPVSKPNLPDMSGHFLWSSWRALLDQWISARHNKEECFTGFLKGVIESFKNRKKGEVKKSLVSLIASIPYHDSMFYPFSNGLTELAHFISESSTNRKVFFEVARPLNLCSRFVTKVEDNSEFQALCYLLMVLIDEGSDFLYEAVKEFDFAAVADVVFDESLSVRTRMPVMFLIAAAIPMSRALRLRCASPTYLQSLVTAITSDNTVFCLWSLILLCRVMQYSLDELPSLDFHFIAAQVSLCLHHKSHEVRAAAVSLMSCFVSLDDHQINTEVLAYVLPLILDMSFLVRHALLALTTKCVSFCFTSFASHFSSDEKPRLYPSFSAILRDWYGETSLSVSEEYREFVLRVRKLSTDPSRDVFMARICDLIIHYLQFDPHPRISTTAKSVSAMIADSKQDDNDCRSSQDNYSITEDFDKPDSESDAIFEICTRQVIAKGLIKPESQPMFVQSRSKSKASATLRAQTSLENQRITQVLFKPGTMDLMAVSDTMLVYHLNPDFTTHASIKVETCVTDIDMVGSHLVICDVNGCATLWDTESTAPTTVWRADPCLQENARLRCTSIENSTTKLLTSCGNRATVLWDIMEQRMVSEWSFHPEDTLTHIVCSRHDENVVILGYESGRMTAFDVRQQEVVMSASIDEGIVDMGCNGVMTFVAGESGKVVSWDIKTKDIENCGPIREKLQCFDVHRTLEMMAFAPQDGFPFITSLSNDNVIQTFNYIESCTATAMHPQNSMVAFGTQHGYMYCYQIND